MKRKEIVALREELKAASLEQLNERLLGLREEQFKLRLQHKTGQLEKPEGIKAVRRNIARVKQAISAKLGESA